MQLRSKATRALPYFQMPATSTLSMANSLLKFLDDPIQLQNYIQLYEEPNTTKSERMARHAASLVQKWVYDSTSTTCDEADDDEICANIFVHKFTPPSHVGDPGVGVICDLPAGPTHDYRKCKNCTITTMIGLQIYRLAGVQNDDQPEVNANNRRPALVWDAVRIEMIPVGVDDWPEIAWKPPTANGAVLIPVGTPTATW